MGHFEAPGGAGPHGLFSEFPSEREPQDAPKTPPKSTQDASKTSHNGTKTENGRRTERERKEDGARTERERNENVTRTERERNENGTRSLRFKIIPRRFYKGENRFHVESGFYIDCYVMLIIIHNTLIRRRRRSRSRWAAMLEKGALETRVVGRRRIRMIDI